MSYHNNGSDWRILDLNVSCPSSHPLCELNITNGTVEFASTAIHTHEDLFHFWVSGLGITAVAILGKWSYQIANNTTVHFKYLFSIHFAFNLYLYTHIKGTPETVYFQRFLHAHFSQPIKADYPPPSIDLIGWEKYERRNLRQYTASGVPQLWLLIHITTD